MEIIKIRTIDLDIRLIRLSDRHSTAHKNHGPRMERSSNDLGKMSGREARETKIERTREVDERSRGEMARRGASDPVSPHSPAHSFTASSQQTLLSILDGA